MSLVETVHPIEAYTVHVFQCEQCLRRTAEALYHQNRPKPQKLTKAGRQVPSSKAPNPERKVNEYAHFVLMRRRTDLEEQCNIA